MTDKQQLQQLRRRRVRRAGRRQLRGPDRPVTGEVFAQAPVSGPADVDRAMTAAATAFESWRDATPAERQQALLKFADAVESRAAELVDAEVRNTGKPRQLTTDEELPPAVDELRFFAGAARMLEGRSAGEYMAGHTSYVRREPIGVCGQVTPWNYPLMMAIWKIAPALAAGNTRGAQAVGHHAGLHAAARRDRAEFFPAGRVQRGLRRPRHRPRAGVPPDAADRVDHRLDPRRHGGRRRGGARPQAHPPRAGRQGAGGALRRRRRRRGRRGDRRRRLLQRRAGLHRGHPGARRPRHPRRLRGRADRAGPRHEDRRAGRRGRALRPAQQRQPARPGHRLRRPAARPRRRCAIGGDAGRRPRLLLRADGRLRACASRTRSSRTRCSARSSPCSGSPTRTRRSAGPTASSTACPRRSGRRTTAGRCG